MSDTLTLALAKGRLADKAIELLSHCGIDTAFLKQQTRKLVLTDETGQYRFIFVKPADVPTYVERGVADVGFVGKDTLLEENKDVYELLDLGFGACKICIAGYEIQKNNITNPNLRVASKYVNIARKIYDEKGVNVNIIKLNGSVELAPIIDLADVIVDIVESGKTLQANDLVVLEDVYDITARFVVNKVSLKLKRDRIEPLLTKMRKQLEK